MIRDNYNSVDGDARISIPKLSLKEGVKPLIIWLIGSAVFGAFFALLAKLVFGEIPPGTVGMMGILAAGMAGASASLWVFIQIRRHGAEYGRQVGWTSSPLSYGRIVSLCAAVFVAERLLQGIYRGLITWLDGWDPESQAVVEALDTAGSDLMMGLGLVATIFIIPVFEEIIFRGHLQTSLVQRFGVWPGVSLAAFIFSLLHFDVSFIVPLFLLGLSFGLIRHVCGSLWPAIGLHMLNNAIATLLLFGMSGS